MAEKAMEELKAKGREKSATYRQYMGNRLLYGRMLDLYKQYEAKIKIMFGSW